FVPQALTPAQRAHYDKNGIAYLEPRESYALLPVGDGLRVAGTALVRFVRALGSAPVVAPLLARLLPRASYWAAAFRRLRTRTYVTTTSYSWPEKPELALCAARAIRSIIWAYSANSLTFSV